MKSEISADEMHEPPGGPRPLTGWLGTETLFPLAVLQGAPLPEIFVRKKVVKPPPFIVGAATRVFREQFYPQVSEAQWSDWRWQFRNRIIDARMLGRILPLDAPEESAIIRRNGALPFGITPYYASLLDPHDSQQAIRRTVVPVTAEDNLGIGESTDPLAEYSQSPVPGLVHRYPDRVLFLVTDSCSTYCRYCTRSRMVGHNDEEYHPNPARWERAVEYIAATPTIRDVLISGGDPLTLSDEKIEWLLSRLRAIKHVEFIRIGTKVPAVLPQRVTPALIRMLRSYHPLWMSLHFTHPDELTPEVAQACERLADAGIPLGSHTVLLKGINDDVAVMKRLMHGLLKLRVRPYYLFQCDPVPGSSHFRTPVDKGLEILNGLRGYTTGYAVPNYVIDAPGGGGKIRLMPEAVIGRDGDDLLLRNYAGNVHRYPDPSGSLGRTLCTPREDPIC